MKTKKIVFFFLVLTSFVVAADLYPVLPANTPVPQTQFRYVLLHFDGSGFDLAQNVIKTMPAVFLDSNYWNYSAVLLDLDGAEIESNKFQVRAFTTYYDESNGTVISGGGSFEEYEKFVKLTVSPDERARFLEIRDTGGNTVSRFDLLAQIVCNFDFYCENARGEDASNCAYDCRFAGGLAAPEPTQALAVPAPTAQPEFSPVSSHTPAAPNPKDPNANLFIPVLILFIAGLIFFVNWRKSKGKARS